MIEQIKISPAAEHIRISPMQKDSRQSLWHTGLFNNMVYKYEMSHLNQFVQWFHFFSAYLQYCPPAWFTLENSSSSIQV